MKSTHFLILIALLLFFSLGAITNQKSAYDDLDADTKNQFQKFKKDFTKKYTGDEHTNRALVFSQNLKKIKQINKQNKGYTLGITQFTDLRQKQFEALYLTKIGPSTAPVATQVSLVGVTARDWSSKAGPIRNQGQCGSCWAFAAVGAIEINERIKKTTLTSTKDYSEQQVVDCCRGGSYYSIGCGGGYPSQPFSYIKSKGIVLESLYPYKAVDGTCKSLSPTSYNLILKSYSNYVGATYINTSLNSGTGLVTVYASGWGSYRSGVFSCASYPYTNHAVVLVGVDSSNNWKIRNSWGTTWGISGYMWLKFGSECGMTYSILPTII